MLKINPKFINQKEYKIASCDEGIINLAIIENFNKHNGNRNLCSYYYIYDVFFI